MKDHIKILGMTKAQGFRQDLLLHSQRLCEHFNYVTQSLSLS